MDWRMRRRNIKLQFCRAQQQQQQFYAASKRQRTSLWREKKIALGAQPIYIRAKERWFMWSMLLHENLINVQHSGIATIYFIFVCVEFLHAACTIVVYAMWIYPSLYERFFLCFVGKKINQFDYNGVELPIDTVRMLYILHTLIARTIFLHE